MIGSHEYAPYAAPAAMHAEYPESRLYPSLNIKYCVPCAVLVLGGVSPPKEPLQRKEQAMKYKIRETVDLIIRASAGLLSKESNQSLMMFVAQFVNRENISEIEEPIEIKKKILREYRVSLNGVTRNLIYFEPYRMGKNVYIIDVNNPKHIFTEQANQLLGG